MSQWKQLRRPKPSGPNPVSRNGRLHELHKALQFEIDTQPKHAVYIDPRPYSNPVIMDPDTIWYNASGGHGACTECRMTTREGHTECNVPKEPSDHSRGGEKPMTDLARKWFKMCDWKGLKEGTEYTRPLKNDRRHLVYGDQETLALLVDVKHLTAAQNAQAKAFKYNLAPGYLAVSVGSLTLEKSLSPAICIDNIKREQPVYDDTDGMPTGMYTYPKMDLAGDALIHWCYDDRLQEFFRHKLMPPVWQNRRLCAAERDFILFEVGGPSYGAVWVGDQLIKSWEEVLTNSRYSTLQRCARDIPLGRTCVPWGVFAQLDVMVDAMVAESPGGELNKGKLRNTMMFPQAAQALVAKGTRVINARYDQLDRTAIAMNDAKRDAHKKWRREAISALCERMKNHVDSEMRRRHSPEYMRLETLTEIHNDIREPTPCTETAHGRTGPEWKPLPHEPSKAIEQYKYGNDERTYERDADVPTQKERAQSVLEMVLNPWRIITQNKAPLQDYVEPYTLFEAAPGKRIQWKDSLDMYITVKSSQHLSCFKGNKGLCAISGALACHGWRSHEMRCDARFVSRGFRQLNGFPSKKEPGMIVMDKDLINDLIQGGYHYTSTDGETRSGESDYYTLASVEVALMNGGYFHKEWRKIDIVELYGEEAWYVSEANRYFTSLYFPVYGAMGVDPKGPYVLSLLYEYDWKDESRSDAPEMTEESEKYLRDIGFFHIAHLYPPVQTVDALMRSEFVIAPTIAMQVSTEPGPADEADDDDAPELCDDTDVITVFPGTTWIYPRGKFSTVPMAGFRGALPGDVVGVKEPLNERMPTTAGIKEFEEQYAETRAGQKDAWDKASAARHHEANMTTDAFEEYYWPTRWWKHPADEEWVDPVAVAKRRAGRW